MVRLPIAWLSGNIKDDSCVTNFALFNNVFVLIILWQSYQSVNQSFNDQLTLPQSIWNKQMLV